jgi:hypothetical protein
MDKSKMRARLASLSFSEKIGILERLRDRDQAIAASGLRRDSARQRSLDAEPSMANTDLKAFCRAVRERTLQNSAAVCLLHDERLLGNVVAVLRQELDSMVRCIYLLSVKDRRLRSRLIKQSLNGQPWSSLDGKRVTDREMVALSYKLQNWTQHVYKFGCAFIHLSGFYDSSGRDAFDALPSSERDEIAHHLSHYHGFHMDANTRFRDIAPVLPRVLEKISSNLECYVRDLERDSDLDQ